MKKTTIRSLTLLLAVLLLAAVLGGCAPKQAATTGQPTQTTEAQAPADETSEVVAPLEVDASTDASRYGGVLNLVYSTMDDHCDINAPGASAGTFFWARYVYESALARGADGKLYPLVCEYEAADDLSWVKLWPREGVTFHDGTPVTIEDVIASYQRQTRHATFENVTDIQVDGDVATFTFDEQGCAKFLAWISYHVADYGVMPKWICEQFDAPNGEIITDPKYVIGTGCYKVIPEEYVNQELMPLERYDGYVAYEDGGDDNGQAAPRRAYMDRINCYVNKDGNNRLMHMLSGDYDVIAVDIDTYQASLKDKGYGMYYDPTGKTIADTLTLLFNMHDNSTSSVVNDPNLRKAILAAVDMELVAQAEYSSWYTMDHSPVIIDGYSTEAFDSADYCGSANIELAKQYLEQSNYNGQTLILRRPATAGSNACLMISQCLEAAGINVDIEPIEKNAYSADFKDGTAGWDMYVLFGQATTTWPGSMPTSCYRAWSCSEEANTLRDELFRYLTGTEESIAKWEEYAKLCVEDAPFFVICRSKGDRFVQAPGLNPNYTGATFYYNAYWDDPSAHMG